MVKVRNLLLLVLSLVILLSSASKTLVFFDFLINQDYISTNLCVKKNVENNCCRGICQLTKQLKQEEKRDPLKSSIEQRSEIFSTEGNLERLKFFFYFIQSCITNKIIFLQIGYYSKSFQPPQVSNW